MFRIHFAATATMLWASFLAPSARADEPAPVKHRIMVCEYSDAAHRLVEIAPDGNLAWEHKFPSVAVCFRMADDGRVLFADGGSPTGVQEVDRQHRVVFDYRAKCEQVMCCDLLPGGNILLAEQGPCRAVEINRRGEVVATVKMATTAQAAHLQTRCVHRLENGHILACHEAEQVVREYDRDGTVVWEYPHVSGTFEALRLPGGNTLIGGGTQKRLFEVTPEKEIVWELTAAEVPDLNLTWVTSLQILANGNLVVANFLRGAEGRGAHAFEVTHDREKKIVWKFADHDLVKAITMVRVLD
jgi:hypothetical protein